MAYEIFYNNLLGLAAKNGWSITRTAKEACLPTSTLSRLVKRGAKDCQPTVPTIMKLAVAFGVDDEDLLNKDLVQDGPLATMRKHTWTKLGEDKESNTVEPVQTRSESGEAFGRFISSWGANAAEAKSDSMAPEIQYGDTLFVSKPDFVQNRDIVIGEFEDGTPALVRVIRNGDENYGRIENPEFPGERTRKLKGISGVVVAVIKKYRF